MITIEELGAIQLFDSLKPAELRELARTAADLRLVEGEFFVHEGDSPALFVVIEGRVELIKLLDGIERVIGARVPGKILGEVPLIYGTQFQAASRATEPSRVIRIDARFYYAAAAASPELARKVGDLARERIGGLQTLAN